MAQPVKRESERKTRQDRVDPKLISQGWKIVPFEEGKPITGYNRCAIKEYPTENGPADYALCVNGKILGIVEAKKVTLGPQNVLTQAERYSRGAVQNPMDYQGFRVPFLYSTNGEIIWHHDVRHPMNRSRQLPQFHSPEALVQRLDEDFDAACKKLATLPNDHDRVRPYQREANEGTEKAIQERKRAMLIAMATGTGKTFTMVNQVYRLMKSGVAKRILFLVDRRALAAQAVRQFTSFEAEPGLKFDKIYEVYSQRFHRDDFEESEKFDPKVLPNEYLTQPKSGHAFVYVCTIQRMMINLFGRQAVFGGEDQDLIDEDADQLKIPIHAFDLIIADECHRGYTSSELSIWRNTLDHFDAIKIGLTATPASHTTTYFKEIVYRYEYERAVREGYLVDYDVVSIESNVRMQGIFLKEGEQVRLVDTETGLQQMDLLEDERQFPDTEIERKITSPKSNQMILEEIHKYAKEHERRYGRFPKTLIFAVNDLPHRSHADQLVEKSRDVFGQGDAFVQKITGRVDRPLQWIRQFRNRQMPSIVVTVDLLSTGVDIPDLEFIVFLRPVKSRILFEQMLGRGTRKGEQFQDKSRFVVFDCFGGTLIEYFRQATAITAEPPIKESRTINEIIEDIWQNRDRDFNIRCLVKRLHRIDKEMSGDARTLFSAFIPQGDVGHWASEIPKLLHKDFSNTMSILKNPGFQQLLVNYPRPKPTFIISDETVDTVSSSWMVHEMDGKKYKPQDYLKSFSLFVKNHASKVTAIGILLNRPQEWNTDALVELKKSLTHSPQQFSIRNLQKAHEHCYHKALVDLISMIKHAAREEEPLLTAEERVNKGIEKITNGRTLAPDQQQWLDRIKAHLVENLSIGKEDFEEMPVLQLAGGWKRADQVFKGHLEDFLRELNEAVAA